MTISTQTLPPVPLGASTVLGYPRIGPGRELKRALEAYWEGGIPAELLATGRELRRQTWQRLAALGLEGIPGNTFSHYDQMLDTAVLLGAIPRRYRADNELDSYFAMARGNRDVAPLPMTKWFDTNYHYLVPEIDAATRFTLNPAKPLDEFREARELGIITRPVIIGPVTFLLLSSGQPLDRLDEAVEIYAELLGVLAAEGVPWVQLDEPALVADRSPAELAAVARAYGKLGGLTDRPRLLVASYFGHLGDALSVLGGMPIEAVGVDLVNGSTEGLDLLTGKTIVAGVVSGRDVWRTDLGAARRLLDSLPGEVVVSTSCSLLHVPYDLGAETGLDSAVRDRLAFAEQKVAEVVALAVAGPASLLASDQPSFGSRDDVVRIGPAGSPARPASDGRDAGSSGHSTVDYPVRVAERRSPYAQRASAQARRLGLPELPVTTIGSFPQTDDLRATRASAAAGRIDQAEYERRIEAEIERAIRLQERLGVDVLVHGEPERNDMVQYFAEHLDGFVTTRHGWVQSYGSRCTRPPIMIGDVSRPEAITVRWARYAQSLTAKPVKGMLTGPVTIVAWSFKRADLPLSEAVWQVASALRGEVSDLEAAGIGIIQVDEPALRELMPLRRAEQDAYLGWAVQAYRHATSGAAEATQIHTHLCYSEAAAAMSAIDGLDADVTTIESARSHAPVPEFTRGLGPGMYDIHSPRIPTEEEILKLISQALETIPVSRLWVNPDCGLKTRTYPQVEAALRNLVSAARTARGA